MKSLLLVLLCLGAVVIQGSTTEVGFRTDIGSYVATSVRDQTFKGQSEHEVQEFWFDGRSSWRVVCVECTSDYSREIVIVGRKAWELRGDTWVRGDFNSLKFPTLSVHAILATDHKELDVGSLSEGPVVDGEPTVVLIVDLGDYGEFLASGLDNEDMAAALREGFNGATARSRYVIGTETGRIYEFESIIDGPQIKEKSVTTVEYGGEVTITSPD